MRRLIRPSLMLPTALLVGIACNEHPVEHCVAGQGIVVDAEPVPRMGPAHAPVELVMFGDFQCPATAYMAMTVDGKITSSRREFPRFTTDYDRRNMDRIRAQSDAVLVGAQTMRADSPSLHVRTPAMQEYRRSLGKSGGLLKILVTASAKIETDSRFFDDRDGGGLLIVTVEQAPAERVTLLAERAEVWRIGRTEVELPELLQRLKQRGVERLLVEGGGELNWALAREDLLDELNVTIAPALLGGRQAPTLLEGAGFPMKGQRRLRLEELRREGDELYCRYTVLR